jgi:hypothetical protein
VYRWFESIPWDGRNTCKYKGFHELSTAERLTRSRPLTAKRGHVREAVQTPLLMPASSPIGPRGTSRREHNWRVIADPDDEATWPAGLRDYLLQLPLGGSSYTSDLHLDPEVEQRFRDILAGAKCRVYHCTRLLPHELEWVKAEGLIPLTQELIARRIRVLEEVGGMTDAIGAAARGQSDQAAYWRGSREGQVCLILGSRIFSAEPNGAAPLLQGWGGEAVYRNIAGDELTVSPGTPTIVVAAVDFNVEPRPLCFPDACNVFVGLLHELEGPWSDVHLHRGVPPEDILDIWQPGDRSYDRWFEGDHPRFHG